MAGLTEEQVGLLRVRSLGFLAPKMRVAVAGVIERMEAHGHDPVLFETLRLPQLQAEYFRRKTSRQGDVLRSMHGHGLAVDLISASKGWSFSQEWKRDLLAACEAERLACGGTWKSLEDWPHLQWGKYPGVVPDALVAAYNAGGLYASWREAGAI